MKLACVNWSGAQLEGYVVNGLDKQPLKFIVDKIAALGFNCIRLVNSMDVIYKNPVGVFKDSLTNSSDGFTNLKFRNYEFFMIFFSTGKFRKKLLGIRIRSYIVFFFN